MTYHDCLRASLLALFTLPACMADPSASSGDDVTATDAQPGPTVFPILGPNEDAPVIANAYMEVNAPPLGEDVGPIEIQLTIADRQTLVNVQNVDGQLDFDDGSFRQLSWYLDEVENTYYLRDPRLSPAQFDALRDTSLAAVYISVADYNGNVTTAATRLRVNQL